MISSEQGPLSSQRPDFEDKFSHNVMSSSGRRLFEDGKAFMPGLSSGRDLFEDRKTLMLGLSSGRRLFEDGDCHNAMPSSQKPNCEDKFSHKNAF